MTTTNMRSPSRVLSLLAAGLVLVVALLGMAAPTAHAEAPDEAFLAALRSQGIDATSPAAANAAGHAVCADLDHCKTPLDVAHDVVNSTNQVDSHAGYLVGSGVAAYCPQYAAAIK